jgi:hypothetical protein
VEKRKFLPPPGLELRPLGRPARSQSLYRLLYPEIRVKILENIYEMLSESRTMYGIKMRGLDEGLKEIDKIHSRFCRIILGVPRFAANNVAELELCRDSTRGKVMSTISKYWLSLLHMDSLEIVRRCYEWQINNLTVECWEEQIRRTG